MRCRALRVRPVSDPDALPLACDGCAPVADKYNVLRLYKKPAHTNEDVANVATVYVAPASLLLHLCLASYFYTVVVRARAHTHARTHTGIAMVELLLGCFPYQTNKGAAGFELMDLLDRSAKPQTLETVTLRPRPQNLNS